MWAVLQGDQPGISTQELLIILTAFSYDISTLQGPVVSFTTFYVTLDKQSW